MKKFLRNSPIILGIIAVVISMVLCLAQKAIVNSLMSQQAKLSKELEQKLQAEKISEGFKKTGPASLKDQESFLALKIPSNEKEPLSVLRQLTIIASDTEVGKISITADKNKKQALTQDLYFFPLSLELECGYSELCLFLKRILSMDRFASIEGLTITRKKEILPRLKVGILLSVYTSSF